jgi:hypothetical protein
MIVSSRYLRRLVSIFTAGACTASATVAIANSDVSAATMLLLSAVLLIVPSLPLGGQKMGPAAPKS